MRAVRKQLTRVHTGQPKMLANAGITTAPKSWAIIEPRYSSSSTVEVRMSVTLRAVGCTRFARRYWWPRRQARYWWLMATVRRTSCSKTDRLSASASRLVNNTTASVCVCDVSCRVGGKIVACFSSSTNNLWVTTADLQRTITTFDTQRCAWAMC
jgi:hypothetical protein